MWAGDQSGSGFKLSTRGAAVSLSSSSLSGSPGFSEIPLLPPKFCTWCSQKLLSGTLGSWMVWDYSHQALHAIRATKSTLWLGALDVGGVSGARKAVQGREKTPPDA